MKNKKEREHTPEEQAKIYKAMKIPGSVRLISDERKKEIEDYTRAEMARR